MMSNKKVVLYPITVPASKYCWEYKPPYISCEFFDNEGGHSKCELGLYGVKDTKDGVLKAGRCLEFKEA